MTPFSETYLGDGLYVSCNGFHVKLRAPRDGGDHEVFLEDWMVVKLVETLEWIVPSKMIHHED